MREANSNFNTGLYTHAYGNLNTNGNSHRYSHGHPQCYGYSYSYTYSQANAYVPSQGNTEDAPHPAAAPVAFVDEKRNVPFHYQIRSMKKQINSAVKAHLIRGAF